MTIARWGLAVALCGCGGDGDGGTAPEPDMGAVAEDCANGADDDGDGYADCADPECAADPACGEVCGNGEDDDGDGYTDCDDNDCGMLPECTEVAEDCEDGGGDEDGDGDADCADSDCYEADRCRGCTGAREVACGDEVFGTNVGGPSLIAQHDECASFFNEGPEAYYVTTVSERMLVTVDLEAQASEDLDLFIAQDDCDTCIGGSASDAPAAERALFFADPGVEYYLIVDGYVDDGSNGKSSFTLAVSCETEEICGNGADDNGNDLGDCDDWRWCGSEVACQVCEPTGDLLACGDAGIAGSNGGAGSTDLPAVYGCGGSFVATGPERVWTFSTDTAEEVTVSMDIGGGTDLELYVLEAGGAGECSASACVGWSAGTVNPEDAFFQAEAGTTYYVVAEGIGDDSADDFDLSVMCIAPGTPCTPGGGTLDCGDVEEGNNADPGDSTDVLQVYSCPGSFIAHGNEVAYLFTAAADGDVTVTVDMVEGRDLEVYVLEDAGACDPTACIEWSTGTVDPEIVTFDAAAGTTYTIVVDGVYGAVDDYEISVDCGT